MRIKYKNLDTNQIETITVENTRRIDTVRIPDINFNVCFGLVIWENPKNFRKNLSHATGGYTIIARSKTISAYLDKELKPLLRKLKKELRNNTSEIDLTKEKTDLDLMDTFTIADANTKK